MRNTTSEWGAIQQLFHWLVVLAVLAQLVLGFTYAGMPSDSSLWQRLFPIHTALGLGIGALMLLRLAWRLMNPVPALPDTLKPWQKTLARATHWMFYLLLIGMPLGGYVLVSTHGQPIPFFGWAVPPLAAVAGDEQLRTTIRTGHALGALLLSVLVLLHVAGALRHEWLLQDDVLRRMTPFLPRRTERGRGAPGATTHHRRGAPG
jgi:cytochrome b561